jgi:hypothetical protein
VKRGRRILLVTAVVVAVTLAALLLWPGDREPVYRGKKLSEWLLLPRQRGIPGPSPESTEAIQHIGTNALPFLVEWIQYRTPRWRNRVANELYQRRLHSVANLFVKQADRATLSTWAFSVLGPRASGAIPQLVPLLTNSDAETRVRAGSALGAIGTNSIPVLISAWTNRTLQTDIGALNTAWITLGTNASPAVPVLIRLLGDKDEAIAATSAALLGINPIEPQLAVTALTSRIQGTNARVRFCAVYALGSFGPQAREAAPLLVRALDDNDASVRAATRDSLREIAPELLTNSGPHF